MVVLEKTLESPLDCKEIQPVHSEDQPWGFYGRNDAKAETLVLWPPHVKSWLIGKDSDAGRDWGQEEKWTTEDEMAGWYHRLNEHESGWTPGDGDGQGGLVCCDSWGSQESDMTERLNFQWIQIMSNFRNYTLEWISGSILGIPTISLNLVLASLSFRKSKISSILKSAVLMGCASEMRNCPFWVFSCSVTY